MYMHTHIYIVSTFSQNCIFSFYSATVIINLSILPTTLVVWKQLWGGSDRCVIKNVNSSAGPKLSLGCGTKVSSNWLCSCIQITGSASAAKQVGKSVTSLWSAVVPGCIFTAKSPSALRKQNKTTKPTLTHTTTEKSKEESSLEP